MNKQIENYLEKLMFEFISVKEKRHYALMFIREHFEESLIDFVMQYCKSKIEAAIEEENAMNSRFKALAN